MVSWSLDLNSGQRGDMELVLKEFSSVTKMMKLWSVRSYVKQ